MVHVDHLNRPVMMTDASKAQVWAATYLPFGGVHPLTGTASLDARLPGQWFQPEHFPIHSNQDKSSNARSWRI